MLQLPLAERCLFIAVIVTYIVSSVLAVRQLHRSGRKYHWLIIFLSAGAVLMQVLMLVLRAIEIKAIPLTTLYESMVVVCIAFGVTFVVVGFTVRQIWFSSVMTWFIAALVLLSAFVVTPAGKLVLEAKMLWVMVHGLLMAVSAAGVIFSCAIAALFLLTRRNLKQKKIARVLGKMPNIEKLQRLNLVGIQATCVLLGLGLLSGAVLAVFSAEELSISFGQWITDSKILLAMAAWLMLLLIVVSNKAMKLNPRKVAVLTLLAGLVLIFAIIGTTVFCDSEHDFTSGTTLMIDAEGQR